jgi:hypothetical protein
VTDNPGPDWDSERFQCGKQVASYLGLVLVEAAQVTVRRLPEWRSKYFHLTLRRGRKIAKVAVARRLAIGLYWMWRKGWNYEQVKKFGSQGRKLQLSYCRDQGFDSIA